MLVGIIILTCAVWYAPLFLIQKSNETRLGITYSEKLLGVHQVDVVTLAIPYEDAFNLCLQSVSSLKFARNVQSDQMNGIIRFRTTMTMRSLGENILLSMSESDSEVTKVVVSSKCTVATTLIDYAKNAENMRVISSAIRDAEKISLACRQIDS